MVVFINGEKEGAEYRKFKIRRENLPNDFAMIAEVLQRRMKHKEWPMPNLIIVDGGKGQISSALEVLKETNNQIPIIGLAKKEETIITPDFKQISLPKDSEALKLIMRIRDEAHRFAITYHRKLRSKSFLP
jgi:excinuclease ABC subunit C